jgi:type IV pilus assembly protein PilA
MLTKLRERAQDEKGFTLIELLVVILIIGILAAIALPAFLGQRTKAQDTEAKTKARTAQTAMETLYVNEQSYATATPAILAEIEPSLNEGPALLVPNKAKDTWEVNVTSETGTVFTITKSVDANGVPTVARTCPDAKKGKGGCPTDGTW